VFSVRNKVFIVIIYLQWILRNLEHVAVMDKTPCYRTFTQPDRIVSVILQSLFSEGRSLSQSLYKKRDWYTRVNKNPSAWNFLSPKPEMTCGTVAIIIRIVLLSPYLRIRAVSLSSIHYNQSHRVYINRRRQYICLIWN